mgnify:CR=1 FL=1
MKIFICILYNDSVLALGTYLSILYLKFLCQKLYQHQFSKEDITTEVQEYYASMPKVYPDFNGGWQPHIVFVGEIIEVRDER